MRISDWSSDVCSSDLPLVGRILIASLFVPFGIGKIFGFSGVVGYIASKNLPLPQVAAAGTIFVEVVVGLAFLVGFKTRYAALILALFTVAAGVIFHNYWASPEEIGRASCRERVCQYV